MKLFAEIIGCYFLLFDNTVWHPPPPHHRSQSAANPNCDLSNVLSDAPRPMLYKPQKNAILRHKTCDFQGVKFACSNVG